jgi:SAM-dependent methyltransferase
VTVVDGGCGLGEWTVTLTRLGYRVIGLDISRETIGTLRRLFPEAEFVAGDIRDTGLPDNSVDLYYSWGVFEHFEEGLQRCIAEAHRVLRPGGMLVLTVPFENRRQRWLQRRRTRPAGAEQGLRFYQWRLTVDELRAELQRGGLAVQEVRPIHRRAGLQRSLHHELGLPYGKVNAAAAALLSPVAPASVFAHMLLAAARKPGA